MGARVVTVNDVLEGRVCRVAPARCRAGAPSEPVMLIYT